MKTIITLLITAGCGGREFAPEFHTVEASGAHSLETAAERSAVLALVNDPAVDFALLDETVGLDRRAARGHSAAGVGRATPPVATEPRPMRLEEGADPDGSLR